MLQDTCLFSGTIMDNIRYSRVSATDEEVIAAAKTAHADEFITRLPNGYSTVVSGSSDNLSEGQAAACDRACGAFGQPHTDTRRGDKLG